MIAIMDTTNLGLKTLDYAALGLNAPEGSEAACSTCAAYRVSPQLSGNLQVDPEIHLPSPGMDVDIAYYYNSNTSYDGPFGYGRTVNTNLTAQASGSPTVVTLTRGDGGTGVYGDNGSGVFVPQTYNLLNTLEKDTTNNLWKETTPDGFVTAYPLGTTGQITSITYMQDAVGNRHTYSYADGLLETLQDAVGRLVTFSYDGNDLLESIEDWAGRRTSFLYDTASIPGNPALTTVIGPSGCQTGYGYENNSGTPRLTRITDPNGYSTTYAYYADSRISQRTIAGVGTTFYTYTSSGMIATNPLGAVTTQTTDAFFNMRAMTDPNGISTTYTRNSKGQETARQNALGAIWTTVYNANNMPLANIDPLGHTTTYLRDSYNNLTSKITADGAITTMVWCYAGSSFDTTGAKRRLQVQIDPLGNCTSYAYNGRGQLLSVQNALGYITSYGYDAFGNQINITNALGNATTLSYDLSGNITSVTNPLGYRNTATYDPQNRLLENVDALGNVTTQAYDNVGNLIVKIDALGYRTSYLYNAWDRRTEVQDALGARITFIFDDGGRVIAMINALGNHTTFTHDAAGRLICTIDALGYVQTFVYNAANNRTAHIDAAGSRSTIIYDLAGQPIAELNALGYRLTTIYDSVGHRVSSIDAVNSQRTALYDGNGRMVANIEPLGMTTSYQYDALGGRIGKQDARGFTSTTVYDAGRYIKATIDSLGCYTSYSYNAIGQCVKIENALGAVITQAYDANGQRVAITYPLGGRTTLVYNRLGRQTTMIDALGNHTSTIFDAMGRVSSRQNSLGYITTYTYDVLSHRIVFQDANGNCYSTSYDARGNLIANQDPAGALTTYLWDGTGTNVGRIDPRNLATTYTLDRLKRVNGIIYSAGHRVTYGFDPAGSWTEMADSTGLTSFAYDMNSRQVAVAYPVGGSLTYLYDATGNRSTLVDCKGGVTTYYYDARNRLSKIISPQNEVTTLVDDALARLMTRNLPNRVIEHHSFDEAGREVALTYHNTTDGQNIATFTSTYDSVGNRLSLQDIHGNLTVYGYDATYQLCEEARIGSCAYTILYTYDHNGNRLIKDENGVLTSYTYSECNELDSLQHSNGSVSSYTWDSNGNLIGKSTDAHFTTYTWDEENRLIQVVSAEENEEYTYSADGKRRDQIINGVSTLFINDGSNLLMEMDESLVPQVQWVNLPGVWGGLISHTNDGASTYYGFDQNYNTRLLMTDSGVPYARYAYDGFGQAIGEIEVSHYGGQSGGSDYSSLLFGGKYGYYSSANSSRVYIRSRYYDTEVGRWLSRDPIGFKGDALNLYRYVGNRVPLFVDPSGNNPLVIACGVACACMTGILLECWSDLKNHPDVCDGPAWFKKCIQETLDGLPDWARPIAEACAAGCVACAAEIIISIPPIVAPIIDYIHEPAPPEFPEIEPEPPFPPPRVPQPTVPPRIPPTGEELPWPKAGLNGSTAPSDGDDEGDPDTGVPIPVLPGGPSIGATP